MANVTTGEAVARYTLRRGSILRFSDAGCVALVAGVQCGLHRGRPLACRLYPLGIERAGAYERFVRLEPAAGSPGVYGDDGTVADFLAAQQVDAHLAAVATYASLIPAFRARIAALVDFDRVELREFWRRATREALAESGFDANPLIDALFDPDKLGCAREREDATLIAHRDLLEAMIGRERDANVLAAASVMLAVSLGYSPANVIGAS